MEELLLGDLVQMRKTHPCGSDKWTVIRVGADIKITENVLMTFSYREDYDNAPAQLMGLRKRDTAIGAGIKLSF